MAVGYLSAHLLFDRLRDRFGYVGGAEYVVIGLLLGPYGADLMSESVVRDLTPLVSLALGWLGMLLGSHFRLPAMALLPPAHVSMAFTEAVTTFGLVVGALLGVFHYLLGYGWSTAAIPAVALASVAALSSPAAVDAFARRGHGTHRLFPVLQLTARIDALIGVVAFGLLLAVSHAGQVAPGVRPPTATEWAVINVAVGVAAGVLFHLFLGPREREADEEGTGRLFVALAGVIVLASGAAYYLNLSPIFTTLVLGFVVANTANAHRDAGRLLASTERPVYLALLIFAGAAWRPSHLELLFVAPAFVAIRLVGRWLAGWLAGTWAASPGLRTPSLGLGLLAQSGLGVALAVNYTQVYPTRDANLVLTATLLSILLFEVIGAGETARLLSATPPPEAAAVPAGAGGPGSGDGGGGKA